MKKLGKCTLDNGLELYYHVIPGKNFLAGEFHVDSGSALEPYNKRGLAHLVEHMSFFGSKHYLSRQKQQEAADRLGLELNATTSNSCVIYPAHVAKDKFVNATKLLVDIMFNPIFRTDVLEREKKVVANEARMYYDFVGNQVSTLFNQTFFRGTPLEESTIGREDHIATITRKDICDYHRKHFVPSNVEAYIYGGLDETLLEAIKSEFSSLAKKPKPEKFKVSMPFMTGIERIEKQQDGIRQCYGNIAFRTCPKTNNDVYATRVIQEVLNGSGKSGLMTKIRHQLNLVYGIEATMHANDNIGYAQVNFSCGPNDLERTLEEAKNMLVKIRPTQSELENVRKKMTEDYKRFSDSPNSLLKLFVYEQEEGHPYTEYLANVARVTGDEVVAFAEKYFENQPHQIVVVGPKAK